MKKAASLHAHLLATVRELADDPAKLHLFVEKGRVVCAPGSLSHVWEYDLIVGILDYAADPATLTVPLLEWITDHEPELLRADAPAFAVSAEIVDSTRSDIEITLTLTERVRVAAVPEGWEIAVCCSPTVREAVGAHPWTLYAGGSEAGSA